ncbi:MAG: response regulator transcription factor [Spirochaetales bacterium]|nr:response regulator transcription factor [Spirochaetales bacterium]
MFTVAVVDDEKNIQETVSYALNKEGFRAITYSNGQEAWEAFQLKLPDCVILDIIMPMMDGLELCRKIRSMNEAMPVIFLTSKDEEFDRVLGLQIGADDYLCKPFSIRELIMRVKVLFRRASLSQTTSEPAEIMTMDGLELDLQRFIARWQNRKLDLTITEFMLLQSLIRQPGFVKTREKLMEEAYPDHTFVSDRTIDSHIKRLRKKFTVVDSAFDCIETVYGVGYRYRICE